MRSRIRWRRAAGIRLGLTALIAAGVVEAASFDFDAVCELARSAKMHAATQPAADLPEPLRNLSYDEYRKIRFRPERAIWRGDGAPFQLQLFHRGFLYPDRVRVNLVQDGNVQPLPYRAEWFAHPYRLRLAELPGTFGYAGLRAHYPLNRRDMFDEVIAFLGNSYFRALGAGQVYGASARGLAVDIGLGQAEEFPRFTEFWAVQPQAGDRALTLYALLNGRSVSGAYQFAVHPGPITRVEVQARLYPRRDEAKWAIAPITSMFLRGEATSRPADDARPEVHDSDGLLIHHDDEWLWRPLMPTARTRTGIFKLGRLRGFGLLQRDRDLRSYNDSEAHYGLRPSVWVEPKADWPRGTLELLELPTNVEYLDNVNAYWVLTQDTAKTGERRLAYDVSFIPGDPPAHTAAKAISTKCARSSDKARFEIVFDGPGLRRLGGDENVQAIVTASRGDIRDVRCTRTDAGRWQASFECLAATTPVELRAFLRAGDHTLSETWSLAWQPK